MPSFINDHKKDYMIEKVGSEITLYEIKDIPDPPDTIREVIQDNEAEIIGDLFLSDYQERGSKVVAYDLGLDHKWVQMSIHYLKDGRKMTHAKIQKLKKIYSVDRLMKE